MFNQKGFIKIALIIFALILIGGFYFVYNNTKNDSITKPFVRIISPNGGENLEAGKDYKIRWESVGFGIDDKVYVYISYKYDDMIASQVFAFPKNTGSLDWKPSVKPGSYKIKIEVYSKEEKKDFSDSSDEFFNISIPSSAKKLEGDSNLDNITNCEDINHIFDVSFVSAIYNLDNSDYNKNGKVELEDARLLMSDLAVRGIKCFSIDSVSPSSGQIGTEVILSGVGFDLPSPGEGGEKILNFGEGVLEGLDWDTEKNKVSFKVPSEICTHDTETIGGCLEGKSLSITPGIYEIFFDSVFGLSNKVNFTVMPNEKISDKATPINPKDYFLVDYPLKQSPIYNQLDGYCSDSKEEFGTIQTDTHLVKNGNVILIPSLRELIFASENQKPDCVTKISMFSAPTNGNYLYLEVSKLSFKEHSGWPIYRLDLSNLSIKKLSSIDIGGSIRIKEGGNFMGFLVNNGTLLSDGKRLVHWDEKSIYLVNLETDSKRILYTAPQNQWLVSNVNPQDVIGKFFDTDVNVNVNQVIIGVYDQNKTFAKNPQGYHDYDINYELMNQITISIPDSR